jgi:hypothetical protein
MLLADKRDLQNSLKVSLLQIEEKELNYYTQNCMTVGTQAALLAGFAFAAIIEDRFTAVAADSQKIVQSGWYIVTTIAMALQILTLIKSMQLSILGPGLALRGPEGSMTRALVAMRLEYKHVHRLFYTGLCAFLISVGIYGWAMYASLENGAMAAGCTAVVAISFAYIFWDYRKLSHKLRLPEHVVTGTFDEINDEEDAPKRPSGSFSKCHFSRGSRSNNGSFPNNATVLIKRMSSSSNFRPRSASCSAFLSGAAPESNSSAPQLPPASAPSTISPPNCKPLSTTTTPLGNADLPTDTACHSSSIVPSRRRRTSKVGRRASEPEGLLVRTPADRSAVSPVERPLRRARSLSAPNSPQLIRRFTHTNPDAPTNSAFVRAATCLRKPVSGTGMTYGSSWHAGDAWTSRGGSPQSSRRSRGSDPNIGSVISRIPFSLRLRGSDPAVKPVHVGTTLSRAETESTRRMQAYAHAPAAVPAAAAPPGCGGMDAIAPTAALGGLDEQIPTSEGATAPVGAGLDAIFDAATTWWPFGSTPPSSISTLSANPCVVTERERSVSADERLSQGARGTPTLSVTECGVPLPATHATTSAIVTIECTEVGGASRQVTWTMDGDASLRQAREAAAERFSMHLGSMVLLREGHEFPLDRFSIRLASLLDTEESILRLQVFAGV